jgi:hypothetical protein
MNNANAIKTPMKAEESGIISMREKMLDFTPASVEKTVTFPMILES